MYIVVIIELLKVTKVQVLLQYHNIIILYMTSLLVHVESTDSVSPKLHFGARNIKSVSTWGCYMYFVINSVSMVQSLVLLINLAL